MDPVTMLMVSGGLGIGQAIFGGIQADRAAKTRRNNVRPDYEIADEVFENEAMYENMAQQGLAEDDLTRMHQNSLRGLSQSLSTGLQLGGDANTVGDYYSRFLDQNSEVGLKNSLQRFSNINQLANARSQVAEQRFIEFGYDKDAPYKDTAQAASAAQQQAVANISGGIGGVANALGNYGISTQYKAQNDILAKALGTPVNTAGMVDRGTTAGATPPATAAAPGNSMFMGARLENLGNMIRSMNNLGVKPPAPNEDFYYRQLLNSTFFKPGERKS